MQGLFSRVVSVVEEVRVATIRFELGGNLQNNGGVTQQDLGGTWTGIIERGTHILRAATPYQKCTY